MKPFILGLDLGRAKDYTALAVIEQRESQGQNVYILRNLLRWRLKISFTDIVSDIKGICAHKNLNVVDLVPTRSGLLHTPLKPILVVDAGGLGAPVADLMKSVGLNPVPIVLTAGERVHPSGLGIGVPKTDLVTNLTILFESKRFKMAKSIKLLPVFLRELKHFRAHTTQTGKMSYGGVGAHDDLVIAVGLALWYAEVMSKEHEQKTKPITENLFIFGR